MSASELARKSASAQAGLIASGEVSAVEVLEASLARIEEVNPTLNAFVTLDREGAKAAAMSADKMVREGETLGPIHGLPIAIKDITETAGIKTTYGSAICKDYVPQEDAEVVRQIRASGGIILGKTNTPEFATGGVTSNELFGATGNPWDPALTPAGSSGGSAAAVASGMVPLAQGTDFGASVRVPAAFCGLVGLRTTPGLISNDPMPLPWDHGQVHGPLARSPEDAALLLDAMAAFDPRSPISVVPPWASAREELKRINSDETLSACFADNLAGIQIDPEIAGICANAVANLSTQGVATEQVSFDVSDGRDAYLALRGEWMIGQRFHQLDRLEDFTGNLNANLKEGLALTVPETQSARRIQQDILLRYHAMFRDFDVILTPMTPIFPFPLEWPYPTEVGGVTMQNYMDWLAPAFLVTLAGLVAASVPVGFGANGLPVGLQVIGPRLSEPKVLSIASRLLAANPDVSKRHCFD
ncbi:MAG: amidase [Pseudomonadota bacterium]|nr:amidase [Pseudomonadota bacterium]